MSVQRIAGSFRDPSGFVFLRNEEVFRSIDDDCHALLAELENEGKLTDWVDRQLIVGTEFVESGDLFDELRDELPETKHFLRHERIPLVTYPYEWSVSMLADAGIHTIDLQIELLSTGCSLKDATAYNVQFVDGKPTMIDIASIEKPNRLDVWFALGQFLQMFVYPLLLTRKRGWDLRSYFQSNLNGRDIDSVANSFSAFERLSPGLLLDLTIPWWLHRMSEKKQGSKRDVLEKTVTNTSGQIFNLKRLRRKIAKLAAGYRTSGVWSDYTKICNYDDEADAAKKELVRGILMETSPVEVLDIGCNTGTYSFLAAECGANVTAVDGDHDAIEVLYRRLRANPASINPLVIDISNPSPAIGYMNVERGSFLERSNPDCVMALALMHHLLVSANMSLEAICEQMHTMTRRDLIIEFVPTDDNMFERLMNYRVDLFQHINLPACLAAFQKRFHLVQQHPIPGSKRTLLYFRKK
ncbi:MAG: SAM-dependent methyltransferase [Mariniblastus sp.]|jgi:SAM-dependent methyltransferase